MIKKSKIEVKNLNKVIDTKRILKDISFTIEPEEHLVIIGGSGAGKSMLAKCILGLEDISSGSIFFDGKNGFLFHLFASKLKNQTLKYSSYIHETKKMIGKEVHINIGKVIKYSELESINDRADVTEYLKFKTYNLGNEK